MGIEQMMHHTTTVIANNNTKIVCEQVPNVEEFSNAIRFGDHTNGVTVYFSGEAFERFRKLVNDDGKAI